MSRQLRPIPIPLAQRLEDARTKIAPFLVFGMALIITAMLWHDALAPSMLVGEVVTVKSAVSSPVPATLQRLSVQRLQRVKAGDVIGELRANDPRQTLDLMQGELTLLRLEANAEDSTNDALTAQRRETLDIERLRLDLMAEKVALTVALANAKKATMDLQLAEKMVNASADAGSFIQVAQLAKEKADNEAKARQALVDTLGPRVEKLSAATPTSPPAQDAQLKRAIEDLQQRLGSIEQSQNVITLRAPIDGIITEVLRHAGENIMAGEPLLVITATQAESIIGYMRQPFPLQPAVGQTVEVRSNGRDRQHGSAVVTRVGEHFEPIINPALHPAPTAEMGLPVEVSLPSNLKLRPGELVGLVIRPSESQNPPR